MLEIEKANKQAHWGHIVAAQMEMAWESEGLRLDKQKVEKGVEAVFGDPAKGQYYVALLDGDFAGCFLTTFEWSDWRNAYCLWIQSVFVPKRARRKGVFSAFYKRLKEKVLADKKLCGLRLYVEKENLAAQKVYQAMGMTNEHYELYEWLVES